jgi:hypothetical protein
VKGIFLSLFRFSHLLILWSFVIAGLTQLQEVVMSGLTQLQEVVMSGLTRLQELVIAGLTRNPLTVVKQPLIGVFAERLINSTKGIAGQARNDKLL